MELGQKLKKARLEAGMTQKQLCEGVVTRNMLSQIENGTAKPSMKTLGLFAQRLGKNISYFLEETAVLSANQAVMEQARKAYDSSDAERVLTALEDYRQPDPVYDREMQLIRALSLLELAEKAIANGKLRYAQELLSKGKLDTAYCAQSIQRRQLLLLGRLPGQTVSSMLPSLDEELMLRSGEARDRKRRAALLDACEDQESCRWKLLRGRLYLEEGDYIRAKRLLLEAEPEYPAQTFSLLEVCFRELGDYQKAYEYACKGRK